jgi:hypothetical protein
MTTCTVNHRSLEKAVFTVGRGTGRCQSGACCTMLYPLARTPRTRPKAQYDALILHPQRRTVARTGRAWLEWRVAFPCFDPVFYGRQAHHRSGPSAMAMRVEPVRVGVFEILFCARTCRRQRAATLWTLEQHYVSELRQYDFQEGLPHGRSSRWIRQVAQREEAARLRAGSSVFAFPQCSRRYASGRSRAVLRRSQVRQATLESTTECFALLGRGSAAAEFRGQHVGRFSVVTES